jgi:hypothetical protein
MSRTMSRRRFWHQLLSENSGTAKDTEKFISNHYENSGT